MIKVEDDHLILPSGRSVRLLQIKGLSRVRKMKEYKKTGKFGFYVYLRHPSVNKENGEAVRFMYHSEFEAFTSRALLNSIWVEHIRKRTRKRTY